MRNNQILNNQKGFVNIGGTVGGSGVQTGSGTPPTAACIHPTTEISKSNPGLKNPSDQQFHTAQEKKNNKVNKIKAGSNTKLRLLFDSLTEDGRVLFDICAGSK